MTYQLWSLCKVADTDRKTTGVSYASSSTCPRSPHGCPRLPYHQYPRSRRLQARKSPATSLRRRLLHGHCRTASTISAGALVEWVQRVYRPHCDRVYRDVHHDDIQHSRTDVSRGPVKSRVASKHVLYTRRKRGHCDALKARTAHGGGRQESQCDPGTDRDLVCGRVPDIQDEVPSEKNETGNHRCQALNEKDERTHFMMTRTMKSSHV